MHHTFSTQTSNDIAIFDVTICADIHGGDISISITVRAFPTESTVFCAQNMSRHDMADFAYFVEQYFGKIKGFSTKIREAYNATMEKISSSIIKG